MKSSGPANRLEMPTLNITAPGVNFKSAAPGSRGSFGCFGIRLDQSTSITSTGSAKTLTENELSYHHFLPQLINFTCYAHGCVLKAIYILDEHCSAVLLDSSGKNVKTHLVGWKTGEIQKETEIKSIWIKKPQPMPNILLYFYCNPFVKASA